jgi:hypothetical protein
MLEICKIAHATGSINSEESTMCCREAIGLSLKRKCMSELAGYVLRISGEEWVDQVFDMAIYYTNLNKKWEGGRTVLFLHKIEGGDAFVGYGVIERAVERDDLSDEERRSCECGGWNRGIVFRYVRRFGEPLLVRETFLKGSKLRGRLLHGMELGTEQLKSVLEQGDALLGHQKS